MSVQSTAVERARSDVHQPNARHWGRSVHAGPRPNSIEASDTDANQSASKRCETSQLAVRRQVPRVAERQILQTINATTDTTPTMPQTTVLVNILSIIRCSES